MSNTKPCIVTTLKNNDEIRYLLDSNKNIVYSSGNNNNNNYIMSLNLDKLKEDITQNKYIIEPQYYYFFRQQNPQQNPQQISNNCSSVRMIEIDLNKDLEDFAPAKISIYNDEILNQYNLSDVDLNLFETTKLFDRYRYNKIHSSRFDQYYNSIPNMNDNYNNISNDKQNVKIKNKKHFAITLLLHFVLNDFIPIFNKLESEIKTNRETSQTLYGNSENDHIQKYYLKNKSTIDEYIDILIDFRKVFVIKEEKKAKSEEEKKTEGDNTKKIIMIAVPIGVFVVILILFYVIIYRNRNTPGTWGYSFMNYVENIKLPSYTSSTHTSMDTNSTVAKKQRLAEYNNHLNSAKNSRR
jgi:hypothetical protein